MSALHRLYAWTIALAQRPNAAWMLAAVSFVESSVFPIPPDVLLIPLILAAPHRAWRLATLCTLASVLGGFVGYAIGYFFFETLGQPILDFYGAQDKYEAIRRAFDEWGAWFIVVKGMTPIPYKFVTIFSGVVQFDLVQFTAASIVSRAIRFFLVAALLWRYGEPIRSFIERRLTMVTTIAVVLLIGGFVAVRYLF